MKRFVSTLSMFVTLAAYAVSQHSQGAVRTVALTGQQLPGMPNVTFEPSLPALNDGGQTAFGASFSGPSVGSANALGYLTESSGAFSLVQRWGSQAVGMADGVTYSDLPPNSGPTTDWSCGCFPLRHDRYPFYAAPNSTGVNTFASVVSGPGIEPLTNDRGLWSDRSGTLSLIARSGTQAPGVPVGMQFVELDRFAFNDSGRAAFRGFLNGPGVTDKNAIGIWAEGPSGVELVARTGSEGPGTNGGTFESFNSPFVLFNNAGQVSLLANIAGGNQGIWVGKSGKLSLVALSGNQAPGMSGSMTFGYYPFPFSFPALNNLGQVSFKSALSGPGIQTNVNDQAIWSGSAGDLALVARNGEHAPGMPVGVNFSSFDSNYLRINDAGQTVFVASYSGTAVYPPVANQGIWSEGSGQLAPVALIGQHAPGTPNGVNFLSFRDTVINNAGQVVFTASVIGPGVTTSNWEGLWATEPSGFVHLIARLGDRIEVAPGDFRTISLLRFVGDYGTGSGWSSGLNDRGQIAFWARFTNITAGAFVFDAVAVPEPSSLVLLALASMPVFVPRQRRRRDIPLFRSAAVLNVSATKSELNRKGALMKRFASTLSMIVALATWAVPKFSHAVTIDMVTVGNPGNAPDTRYNSISVGSVGYRYQIGKYEVTAGQYTEFLNAVAQADPNGLYNPLMGHYLDGVNILQSGSSPNFSYSVGPNWAERPVNFVGFWDAARFANWLHNGQPTGPQGPGTTEDGAYHDVGKQTLFGRNAGARFFVPTEDEWYKAAFHDKAAGLAASYFDYPTGTYSAPGSDTTESTNPGNNANFNYGVYTGPPWQTEVGEFQLSHSPYGTFDQGGNVSEYSESYYYYSVDDVNYALTAVRGGASNSTAFSLRASSRSIQNPSGNGGSSLGFRVASIPDLPGDFNHDGTVDAADYVVWRKNPGGIYTSDDYNTWRANFGRSFSFTSGSGASANTAVPEPATLVMLVLAAAGVCSRRRRAARTVPKLVDA